MDVVAIHIDSTDMQFHSFPASRIAAGTPESQATTILHLGQKSTTRFYRIPLNDKTSGKISIKTH